MFSKNGGKSEIFFSKALIPIILLVAGAIVGHTFTQDETRSKQERDAYFEMLKKVRENSLDIKRDPDTYIDETSIERAQLAIFGAKDVLISQIEEWSLICVNSEKKYRKCCGDGAKRQDQIIASIDVVSKMRNDSIPWFYRLFETALDDDDLAFYLHFCKLDEVVLCDGDETRDYKYETHCFKGNASETQTADLLPVYRK